MEQSSQPIIISFREGCSGSWLGEILTCCRFGTEYQVNFRQDINGVPPAVYHFSGHRDDKTVKIAPYREEPFITCHADQPELLLARWPGAQLFRIIPTTYVLDAIAAAWYKIKPEHADSVDDALEYIKNYYRLHTELDPRFGTVIDYGMLRDPCWVREFVNAAGIEYNPVCDQFTEQYWALQKKSNFKTIPAGLDWQTIINTVDMETDIFSTALIIFVYELSNGLTESQRLWSVNDTTPATDLLSLRYAQ